MNKALKSLAAVCLLSGVWQTSVQAAAFDAAKGVNVVSRESGSGTRGAFVELFGVEEKTADGKKKDTTTKEAIIAKQTDVMMTNIASDRYAIGYISLGSLNSTIKPVKIDGVSPSSANIKNGSYKIARPFNIAVKSGISPLAQSFIDFILSKEGQAVIAKNYIAINDDAKPFGGSTLSGKIVVAGSSSVTPVMEKLREAYLLVNKNAKIEIQMSDSSAGINAAIEGTCDIGMASRELKASELQKLAATQIALDGVVVIVNKENPLDNLTKDQVKSIFSGKTTKWNEALK
ncbi:MAG: substrate-binding domain-containing protein [Helicobacteraceae bacterium]|jgi:phosphate transport system substrate-binding protein|nr:substrate-binding domain-containing protein [Helicobacteraceae bacterium]